MAGGSDDVRIIVSAEDQASAAIQTISNNVIGSFEKINQHGGSVADTIGDISDQINGLPTDRLGGAADGLKDMGTAAVGVASDMASLYTNLAKALEVGGKFRTLLTRIAGGGSAAVAGVAAVIGAPIAIMTAHAYDRKRMLDDEFRRNSQISPEAAGRDEGQARAVASWEKNTAELIAKAAAAAALKKGQADTLADADKYVAERQRKTSLIGAKPADIAESEFRQSKEFGALTGTQAAERIGVLREDADLAEQKTQQLKEQAELKQRMDELDAKAVSTARSWIEKGMTEADKRKKDELELLALRAGGSINDSQYQKGLDAIGFQYAKHDDKDKTQKVRLDLGGNDNVYQSRFATRGLMGETSQLDLLKKLLHELQSGNHADRLDAKRLVDEMRRQGIDLTASSPI